MSLKRPAGAVADTLRDPLNGLRRAVIDRVLPQVDCGRFAIKRCVGDTLEVMADAFVDGHEVPRVRLMHRRRAAPAWEETEMTALGNDRWRGSFTLHELGGYEYTVIAWPDSWLSWKHDFERRVDAADIEIALAVAAELIDQAAGRAPADDAKRLRAIATELASEAAPKHRHDIVLGAELQQLMLKYPAREAATLYGTVLPVIVDPPYARFSAWYELFPRSVCGDGTHGRLPDVEAILPQIAELGFDVLYLPPIHPIGITKRKGKNNALKAKPDDCGSPWAIGSIEGGHKSVHPELGTPDDVARLARAARLHGIELALDIAFQCSPDHPYAREHPEWFKHRPDGSVQFAENPPKRYEDIYPFNFDSQDWQALWHELESVFVFWIERGVHVFRVDNPHTKPFAMWEWMIGRLKADHPQLVFLSEAFTRPKVMHRLAKLGYTQSYTYFAWRNTKTELIEYFTELTKDPSREYFRPNVWPNTPDILTEVLQQGGRAAFMTRLVLATTLSASYGVYGPAFENLEHVARSPGSEEYLDSEKYQIRQWPRDKPGNLRPLMRTLNRIRRDNVALQSDWSLAFHGVNNDQLLCFSKTAESNAIVVVVNLDHRWKQSGWVDLDLTALGLKDNAPFIAHDLLTGAHYSWHGRGNYVALDPAVLPAHVLRIEAAQPIAEILDARFG